MRPGLAISSLARRSPRRGEGLKCDGGRKIARVVARAVDETAQVQRNKRGGRLPSGFTSFKAPNASPLVADNPSRSSLARLRSRGFTRVNVVIAETWIASQDDDTASGERERERELMPTCT
jgi:hypothetical protein